MVKPRGDQSTPMDAAIIGPGLQECVKRVQALAERNLPVLLVGETGTGKELLARRYIVEWERHHEGGTRSTLLNCTGLSDELLRSELFGHVKGAFTDARNDHDGLITKYDLICLDELGDTKPGFQAQLLRVVENGEYLRVGSNAVENRDVRFIASTNRAEGVRADLGYRFHRLMVPPLAVRGADIVALVENTALAKGIDRVTARFVKWAACYTWPGNVRELLRCLDEASLDGLLDMPRIDAFTQDAASDRALRLLAASVSDSTAFPIAEFPHRFSQLDDPNARYNELLYLKYERMREDGIERHALVDIAKHLETLGRYFGHRELEGFINNVRKGPAGGGKAAEATRRLRDAGSVRAWADQNGIREKEASRQLKDLGVDPMHALRGYRKRRSRTAKNG